MQSTQNYRRSNNIINQLQALENLTIAILLQQPLITESKRTLEEPIKIELVERKKTFLEKYVMKYDLGNHVTFMPNSKIVTLHHSLVVERIVRDWTRNGVVIGVNPNKVSSELFMLWICLFARKTEKNVVIDTSLEEEVKQTVSRFFSLYLQTNLIDKGKLFQIMPFTNILLKSYQEKRTLEETKELNNLLTDKERIKLRKILLAWEDYHEII